VLAAARPAKPAPMTTACLEALEIGKTGKDLNRQASTAAQEGPPAKPPAPALLVATPGPADSFNSSFFGT